MAKFSTNASGAIWWSNFATNASGAMLLPNSVQVTESISGSVVPLAMFFRGKELADLSDPEWLKAQCFVHKMEIRVIKKIINFIHIYEIGIISKVNGSKGKAWRHSLQVSQMHRWSGMQGQELTLTINL